MAITSTGLDAAYNKDITASTAVKDKTALGKDDFMTLLLVELQHQDPTEPMDSEKILAQTSQLAGLEASENTNKALADLASSLSNTQQFSTISAIGKTADLGSNSIGHDKGSTTSFELYFPDDISSGSIDILDADKNVVSSINLEESPAGVAKFDWNGMLNDGNAAESGVYHITANYTNSQGDTKTTKLGIYPIESIKFQEGNTLVKVGSNYVPLSDIVEVY